MNKVKDVAWQRLITHLLNCHDVGINKLHCTFYLATKPIERLCIKVGRGHGDACVGTRDVGTRDEGLEDIKYGTRGRVERGRGGCGDDNDY